MQDDALSVDIEKPLFSASHHQDQQQHMQDQASPSTSTSVQLGKENAAPRIVFKQDKANDQGAPIAEQSTPGLIKAIGGADGVQQVSMYTG